MSDHAARYIALAGKGSAGKSTLMPFIVEHLKRQPDTGRLLVVDADPHQSAGLLLHVPAGVTLGQLRSQYEREFKTGAGVPEDESREEFAERLMGEQALIHCAGYDYLALGHWELPGSNCTPNRVLGRALDHLAGRYDTVLIDNEAGIEHMGRYTHRIDVLLLVTTPERLALDVAGRILAHGREIGRPIGVTRLIFNRLSRLDMLVVELDALAQKHVGLKPMLYLTDSYDLQRFSRADAAADILAFVTAEDDWRKALEAGLPALLSAAAAA